jgi:hypothetical protein
MATPSKFNIFVLDVSNGKHNLGSDNLKVALSNVAPVATNAVFADITEIAAGNGYTAGGTQATLVSNTQTSGTQKLILNNVTFTASGGAIATFRYVVLYNSTQTTPLKPLIAWIDYGAAQSVTTGNSFQVQFDAANGVLQLA